MGKLPAGLADDKGATVAAQVVGIGYNPSTGCARADGLFKEPFVSRLGLTGFQTTFGTVSIIEILQGVRLEAERRAVLHRDQEGPADRRDRGRRPACRAFSSKANAM